MRNIYPIADVNKVTKNTELFTDRRNRVYAAVLMMDDGSLQYWRVKHAFRITPKLKKWHICVPL